MRMGHASTRVRDDVYNVFKIPREKNRQIFQYDNAAVFIHKVKRKNIEYSESII